VLSKKTSRGVSEITFVRRKPAQDSDTTEA